MILNLQDHPRQYLRQDSANCSSREKSFVSLADIGYSKPRLWFERSIANDLGTRSFK
jgi:hypothetical protein